ncbi:MAG: tRNA (adenosine(37)-N6)-threonylcarbamoyltransferase complex transferase subunit TsaD [Christensenellaceae bacterium]|nr:tRNA (adenosine(37)-N6)-threonylcarbamoyltransferase complex transferase subunit TsaD [Christensenellaceae bacterium]
MEYKLKADAQLAALAKKENVNILAIETSCDETAAAVVQNGRTVKSSVYHTQIAIHAQYGGVVPEIASRNHLEKLPSVVEWALKEANCTFEDIDAVAVTYGPGLVGALLTGVSYAKALAYGLNKPLIPVNHIEGHICANYITHAQLEPPFICLIVSGGHTNIVKVEDYGVYRPLGSTRDDAAGEAFDKVARVLGLSYPGGPNLQKLAETGDPDAYTFPKSFKGEHHLDFSFSGLKTAVINMLHQMDQKKIPYRREDVAASFQKTVANTLMTNTFEAARREGLKVVALAGGVSANAYLRDRALQEKGIKLYLPDLKYCTDNAAMIASAAYYRLAKGAAGLDLNAIPSLELV